MGLEYLINLLQQVQIEWVNSIITYYLNICIRFTIGKLEKYLGKTNYLTIWFAAFI